MRSLQTVAFLAILAMPGAALQAAAPPSVQGIAARAMVRGVELGQSTFVTIRDQAKTEAIGLPGISPGQQVEVSHPSEGKWVVKDPRTNRAVTLDKAPNLETPSDVPAGSPDTPKTAPK